MPPSFSVQVVLPRATLVSLLDHAAIAARLVGQLDERVHPAVADSLGDHVDAIVHALSELLGDPRALNVDESTVHESASMLASAADGAR